ncbi:MULTISPECIES: DUF6338 family protein [unclassified Phaeobacter]|uniref:DUF6338 family protein n=1 Tax=unclassified Phaeobacter TaxID=2621772 RepID=UPI003A85E76F
MDFALAQLALIFMPGIIWATIDAMYGAGLKPQQTTLLIRAFMFGMATYAVLFLIYLGFGKSFGYQDLVNGPESVNFFELKDEIAWSVPLSFSLAVCWLWIVKFRLLVKLLHKIGATRRYGDEDVWSYTLNSDQANVEYVHFRDLENGFIFAGWVNAYSESEDFREILLASVIVYDEAGNEISRAPFLYLSRPKNNIWMEFPYRAEGYKDVREEDNHQ